jgi:hypothetical protein
MAEMARPARDGIVAGRSVPTRTFFALREGVALRLIVANPSACEWGEGAPSGGGDHGRPPAWGPGRLSATP